MITFFRSNQGFDYELLHHLPVHLTCMFWRIKGPHSIRLGLKVEGHTFSFRGLHRPPLFRQPHEYSEQLRALWSSVCVDSFANMGSRSEPSPMHEWFSSSLTLLQTVALTSIIHYLLRFSSFDRQPSSSFHYVFHYYNTIPINASLVQPSPSRLPKSTIQTYEPLLIYQVLVKCWSTPPKFRSRVVVSSFSANYWKE